VREGSRLAPHGREIRFSQGVAWKALIKAYMSAIPFKDDASCMPIQSMSDRSPANAVHSASSAKVSQHYQDFAGLFNPIENIVAAKEHSCLDDRRPCNIWIDDFAH